LNLLKVSESQKRCNVAVWFSHCSKSQLRPNVFGVKGYLW